MKLIREEIESVDFIVEERNGKKSMYIEGIFLQGDIQNRNGRMYPIDTLRKEVQRYNESNIVTGRALGELGHPDGPTVNLDRVSHKIVSLKENGSNFIGKAKILNTPMGNIAKSLIDEGVKLGVSSRGVGSLRPTKEGYNVVSDDFMLSTAADIVADPSAPDAFVEGIMEGKDWVWDGGVLREQQIAKTYKTINTLVDKKQLDENTNPPNFKVEFFKEQKNLSQINCYSNEGDVWEKSKTSFNNNSLTIEFREPFKPRRGRINCSLNDNGKWRWFGVQFPIKKN